MKLKPSEKKAGWGGLFVQACHKPKSPALRSAKVSVMGKGRWGYLIYICVCVFVCVCVCV